MIWMDVDAALAEVPVNIIPLVDAATAKVIDEGVTYNEAGMDLIWHFETTAGANTATPVTPTTGGDYDWAHTDGGMYTIEMTATGGASANNDTEGFGYFTGNTTANLPWRGPTIGFRAAALNNALIDGGDNLDVNVVEVSGDSTAADNLELQYDTTGLTGDTFPSTQAQVGAISAGGGGFSLNASGSTVTTGNETNSYTDTFSSGVIYIVEDDTGTTLFDFDFDFSSYTGVATKFLWDGYIQSQGDTVLVQYYNWPTTSYLTLETLNGLAGTTVISKEWDVPVGGTGTGANFGLAKLRFTSSTSTAIGTDRVRSQFSQAITGITNGSTITLAASAVNKNFVGRNWNLVLGSQAMSNAYIEGANVSGAGTGSGVHFDHCHFAAGASIPAGTYAHCGFAGTSGSPVTESGIGQYIFDSCYSEVAGSGTPYFNFAGAGGTVGVNNRGWLGGFHFTGDANVTVSHEVLAGGGTTIITGGGNAEIRGRPRSIAMTISASETVQVITNTGPITITDSGSASPTVNLYGECSVLTDAGGLATDYTLKTVDLAAVLVDTAQIGVAGAGLTDLGGMSTGMKAEVNAECDTSLSDYGALKPTVAGRTLDVTAGGTAGMDYANIESPTTTIDFTGTTIGKVTLVLALDDDIVDVDAVADGTLTTAKFATDFLTNALIADGALDTEQFAADFLTNALIADGALDTEQFAADTFTSALFADGCFLAVNFNADVWTTSADALLKRDVDNVEATANDDTLCGAILAALHWTTSGSNILVYQTDNATLFMTLPITTDPNAEPVVQVQ